MIDVPVEDLLKQTGSIFKLVVLAAKRTTELTEGYRPKIEPSAEKPSSIALLEISEGKIEFELTDD